MSSSGVDVDINVDILISDASLAQKSLLVTRNIKEFGIIKKSQEEDWYSKP